MRILACILVFFTFHAILAQNDTINQIDAKGRKQGHWIYYGIDRPDKNYPDSAKIEEGGYVDDRKEGMWRKYDPDGKLRIEGFYKNNRPETNCVMRSSEMIWFSNCTRSEYDSIVVHLGHANMYGPITDTSVVVYPNSVDTGNYLDSLSVLDTSFQTRRGVLCSHSTNISIKKYFGGNYCETLFSTCSGNYSKAAKVARECAYKVFGKGKLED